jgi:hypothetical protein
LIHATHFIPRTGSSSGVHDFTHRLANAMTAANEITGTVIELSSGTKAALALSRSNLGQSVILHYSGYGYAKRGAPLWLVRFVRSLQSQNRSLSVLTMFHEVMASGPITSSAFWMQPFQKWVAKRLLELSNAAFTNCTRNAEALHLAAPGQRQKVRIIPVFSNFGEPDDVPPISERAPQLVLFTSNLNSRTPSSEFWNSVEQVVSSHRATQVTVIGRLLPSTPKLSVPIQQLGFLDAHEVSRLLSQSSYGFAYHAPQLFGKSTIFAAFAAHGVIPIVPVESETLPDGLKARQHYLRPQEDASEPELSIIRSELLKWYQLHNLHSTAARYTDALHQFAKAR